METIAEIDDFLEHVGVKGMKWGVRKEPLTESEAAKRKKIIIGASIAAAILATAAISYAVYDHNAAKGLEKTLDEKIGNLDFERLKGSAHGDRMIREGKEFTRRSYERNAAWNNPLRTYVVEGKDNGLITKYGDKVYKFKAAKQVNVAGLDTQLKILRDPATNKALRKATADDLAKYSLSGKRLLQKKMSDEKFANLTIETLRKGAWDAGEDGSKVTAAYVKTLIDKGYSAVNDLNLPGSAARILLDEKAFVKL